MNKEYKEGGKIYEFVPSNSLTCKHCCFYNPDLSNKDCNGRPCMSHLREDKLNGYFINNEDKKITL